MTPRHGLSADTRDAIGRRLKAWIEYVEREQSTSPKLLAALRKGFLMDSADSDARLLAKFRDLREWTQHLDEETERRAFGALPAADRELLAELHTTESRAIGAVLRRGTIGSVREYELLMRHADALAEHGSDPARLARVNELLARFDSAL